MALTAENIFYIVSFSMLGVAVIVFLVLFRKTAGYGLHYSKKWGWSINNRLGWVLMEVPTVLVYGFFFYMGYLQYGHIDPVPLLFAIVWNLHYLNRTFIFPFLIRGKSPMPMLIVSMGVIFNSINAYLQAYWLYILSPDLYTTQWILSVRFIAGVTIFFVGFFINLQSDRIIRNLRPKNINEKGVYKIPEGGLYKYVSCPSYLGEILEWTGWAIATWSLAGLVFPIWTFANLAPRAIKNHKWYHEKFGEEYPSNRKALIPGVF